MVSYPNKDGGGRVEFRIEAQFAVAPEARVTVKKDANGLLVYSYVVQNGPAAKRPIREFALTASVEDAGIALRHQTWKSTLAPLPHGPDSPVGGPRLFIRAGAGRIVSWKADAAANGIKPFESTGGFQITSRFLPGITAAFGSSDVPAKTPDGLPPEVAAQLEPVLAPEHNWKTFLTIGPKFNPADGPSKDPVWVASDFLPAIENLRLQGAVGSPFMEELVSLIEAVRSGGQRVPFRYSQSPKTPLEAEIGEAAKISLSTE